MNLKSIRSYCLKKKGATENFPFGDKVLVMNVGKKMFALIFEDEKKLNINLKCDPFLAVDLRDEYPSIKSGYHMNKEHWNTIVVDGSLPDKKIKDLIDHSYELVAKVSKKPGKNTIKKGKSK